MNSASREHPLTESDFVMVCDVRNVRPGRMSASFRAMCERLRDDHAAPYAFAAEAICVAWRHILNADEKRLLCLVRDRSTREQLAGAFKAPKPPRPTSAEAVSRDVLLLERRVPLASKAGVHLARARRALASGDAREALRHTIEAELAAPSAPTYTYDAPRAAGIG